LLKLTVLVLVLGRALAPWAELGAGCGHRTLGLQHQWLMQERVLVVLGVEPVLLLSPWEQELVLLRKQVLVTGLAGKVVLSRSFPAGCCRQGC
jgi:hypothetical protein